MCDGSGEDPTCSSSLGFNLLHGTDHTSVCWFGYDSVMCVCCSIWTVRQVALRVWSLTQCNPETYPRDIIVFCMAHVEFFRMIENNNCLGII